ncbi:hypothetical protein [Bradyrhizobium sp.]|uniref:hypothetical protein n=1 Tax=Bradyrhizobium sp. TaxID=376 RepID=UPI003C66DCD9
MSGYYAANPHYAPDDFSEDHERYERCQAEAGRWFNDLTGPQLARYHERMFVIRAYKGAPRWDFEAKKAHAEFAAATKDAARVSDMVLRDLLLTGEVSEATSYAFDECLTRQTMAEVA